jgi:hypothetical protein
MQILLWQKTLQVRGHVFGNACYSAAVHVVQNIFKHAGIFAGRETVGYVSKQLGERLEWKGLEVFIRHISCTLMGPHI